HHNILKISKDYVPFSPTIKGINYWDKQLIDQLGPAHCEDEVEDLTVSFFWPAMTPAGKAHLKRTSEIYDITASLKPMNSVPSSMGYLKNFYTASASETQKKSVAFDPRTLLYSFKGNHGATNKMYSYFWANNTEGEPWVFIMCTPLPTGEPYICQGQYFFTELQSLVVLSFSATRITNWKSIINDTNKLILSNIIK
ncbi:hypothetical protein, partial [Pseudomonas syringae]